MAGQHTASVASNTASPPNVQCSALDDRVAVIPDEVRSQPKM